MAILVTNLMFKAHYNNHGDWSKECFPKNGVV